MSNVHLFNRPVRKPAVSPKQGNNLTGLDYNAAKPANVEDFRPGQLFMIQLRKLDPGFYLRMERLGLSCFYDSSKMEAVMKEWAKHLEDRGMERQIKIQRDELAHGGAIKHLRHG